MSRCACTLTVHDHRARYPWASDARVGPPCPGSSMRCPVSAVLGARVASTVHPVIVVPGSASRREGRVHRAPDRGPVPVPAVPGACHVTVHRDHVTVPGSRGA